MADYRADEVDRISMRLGQTVTLESLRQAVVPPYIMLMPFLNPPEQIEVIGTKRLPGEGVHGCVYSLRAIRPGTGTAEVGFKDLRSGETTHRRALTIVVESADES